MTDEAPRVEPLVKEPNVEIGQIFYPFANLNSREAIASHRSTSGQGEVIVQGIDTLRGFGEVTGHLHPLVSERQPDLRVAALQISGDTGQRSMLVSDNEAGLSITMGQTDPNGEYNPGLKLELTAQIEGRTRTFRAEIDPKVGEYGMPQKYYSWSEFREVKADGQLDSQIVTLRLPLNDKYLPTVGAKFLK
jgi:hypothetical protein